MVSDKSRIVIAGSGSIGCYVGGSLAAANRNVNFFTRPRAETKLRQSGLRIVDLDGAEHLVSTDSFQLNSDPKIAFAGAQIILVSVKSGATEEIVQLISQFAPDNTIVVSLQNGVSNAETLRRFLPDTMTVVAGMVPFNVVQSDETGQPLTVRRTTQGTVLIGDNVPELPQVLSTPSMPVQSHTDIQGVLWGKLLMNLNNAPNALSNLPLAQQLADRNWRKLVADLMSEGLAAMTAHNIRPAKVQGVKPAILPWILRLPDVLFRVIARRMLAIDPRARSSMWEDFSRGRTTEIDYLQGVVIRLASEKGLAAPLSAKVIACVKKAEGKPLRSHSVDEIRA
ncbi:2-dehydropantoate 2-reductase [Phyllobacterium sp. YR531]|uniref:2-dehydropantoate 2-reductase n=1 Tax=Phyllobacterium sp. YR531 TaxID=1144343 RepID=UPI00026F7E0C|nr:2-dehydropantoate 2-reductase [Phyllobacterium sp. YR531]EJN05217.1 2-dehydropantoate 2-reductase [Phyllobacterium sp. YR531]